VRSERTWAFVGVLSELAPGPPLAQQVPALVELDLDAAQSGVLLVDGDLT